MSLERKNSSTSESSPIGARRMVGHASIYAAGNILRQLCGFLMLPVYTRYLTPADYGVVGLMVFAISLMEPLFGARLGQAIMKYYFDLKNERQKAVVISTAVIMTGVISTATMVFIILFRNPASRVIFGNAEYTAIVGLFSVLIVTQALEYYALLNLRFQQRPWLYISLNFSKLILQLTLNIWLVVFEKLEVMGVAISAMASSSLFALVLTVFTLRQVGFGFNRALAVKMIRYSWPLWIAGFAGLYIGSASRYYLRIFGSLDDVGLFELAVRFSAIIEGLIWEPFSLYWQVERYRYYHRGNAKPIFRSVFSFVSTIMILAALGIAIFSGPVIRIMADASFYQAAKAVPPFVFGTVFISFVVFFQFGFEVKEETGWISRNLFLTAGIITVFYITLIPLLGYVGASIAFMLAEGSQFLIVYHTSRRFYDMGITLTPLVWMLLISALACWLAIVIFAQEGLKEDIAVKSFIYLAAGTLILIPIARNLEVRQILHELVPRFVSKS